jgi:hypothetical protein
VDADRVRAEVTAREAEAALEEARERLEVLGQSREALRDELDRRGDEPPVAEEPAPG